MEAVTNHFEDFKEALARGAKIRYITHIPKDEKLTQIIKRLTETGFFEVKFAPTIQNGGLGVVDKKLVRILPCQPIKQELKFYVQTSALVDLMQDYFELKWQSATTLDSTKNDFGGLLDR